MTPAQVLTLSPGGSAPRQGSAISCGSAALTVARMMIDPVLTRWIETGVGCGCAPDARAPAARFAEHEQQVMARTNAVVPRPGAVQPPWPRFWGTPPWGALGELEHGAALSGTTYAVSVLRHLRGPTLHRRLCLLAERLDVGTPMLLYVGNSMLPRHILLAFVCRGSSGPALYDPATGRVAPFRPVDPPAALGLVGVALWGLVYPAASRPARSAVLRASAVQPRMAPAGAAQLFGGGGVNATSRTSSIDAGS